MEILIRDELPLLNAVMHSNGYTLLSSTSDARKNMKMTTYFKQLKKIGLSKCF